MTLPLASWRVVVTRPRHQAGGLSARLRRAGAVPLEVPTIEIGPPADGGEALREAARRATEGAFDWLVFTSANGVDRFFSEVGARGFPHGGSGPEGPALFGQAKVAAIGEGTAAALSRLDLKADLVPGSFVAEALAEAVPAAPASGGRVLLPRAAVARDVLPETLREKGWVVEVVEAYRTAWPGHGEEARSTVREADAVTFTSSSTVRGFVEIFGAGLLPPVVCCIGPVTSATARAAGIEVAAEARVHSAAGVVEALVSYASGHDRS